MAITSGLYTESPGTFFTANEFPAGQNLNEVLNNPVQGLYIGEAGDLIVKDSTGKNVTFTGLPAGALITIRPKTIESFTGAGGLASVIILV